MTTIYEVNFMDLLRDSETIFVLIVAFAAGLIYSYKKEDIFKVFICGFGLFLAGIALFVTSYSTIEFKYWLASGNYKIVQGKVESFKPMPYEGHADESFSVNGVTFKYSDYEVTGAFNNTRSHGGPIYPGRIVKIYYNGGLILKMEAPKDKT